MSYDLEIWSVLPMREDAFRRPEIWRKDNGSWTRDGKTWQIVISESDKVQPEDVPKEIAKLLPGIEFLTQLNLEGTATEESSKLVQSTADGIARSTHGAVFDPQEDSLRLPSGVKRFVSPGKEETFEVVALSWWFLDSPLLTSSGQESLVMLMEQMLPEALPRRYGLYEPPQHIYVETGRAHFLEFLKAENTNQPIWYPHRPAVSVTLNVPNPLGAYHMGFRAGEFRVELERSALLQPGWSVTLKRFWEKASLLISPIYGDVRILGGYSRHGGAVFQDSWQPSHPVSAWWWTGIPRRFGNAVVLGSVYQRLWPSFLSTARLIEGFAFATTDHWSVEDDLAKYVGDPPADQTQVRSGFSTVARNPYPTGWPFGEIYRPR